MGEREQPVQRPPGQTARRGTALDWTGLLREDGLEYLSDVQVAQRLLIETASLARAGCADGACGVIEKLDQWPSVMGLTLLGDVRKMDLTPGGLDRSARAHGRPGHGALVAMGRVLKGLACARSGRGEAAVLAFDDAIARLEKCEEPDAAPLLPLARRCKAAAPPTDADLLEVLHAVEELAERVAGIPDDPVVHRAVDFLQSAGVALAESGRAAEAEVVWDEVVRRAEGRTPPPIRLLAMQALHNKGVLYGHEGRAAESCAALEEAVRRYGGDPGSALAHRTAEALLTLSRRHAVAGRTPEALAALDELLARFGDRAESRPARGAADAEGGDRGSRKVPGAPNSGSDDPYEDFLAADVVDARNEKGKVLLSAGRAQEALREFDECLRRFGDRAEMAIIDRVRFARVLRADTLAEMAPVEEATRAYDDIVNRYGEWILDDYREIVANALNGKGIALAKAGRVDEAVAAFDEIVRRYGHGSWPAPFAYVPDAFVNKAGTFVANGRPGVALAVLEDFLREFEARKDSNHESVLQRARLLREDARRAVASHRPPGHSKVWSDAPPKKWWQVWK